MDDQLNRLARRVRNPAKPKLLLLEYAVLHHVAAPCLQALPELCAHKDRRKRSNLLALNKGRSLKQFVKRAQSTRHHDKGAGIFDKHYLAREEIVEVNGLLHVWVRCLFMRKNDIKPITLPSLFERAAIGSFHDAWSATG